MISHVSLGVREFAKSAPFYDAILDPLGYPRVADTKPNELAYGPPGAALFWLYETPGEGSLASAGMHIAFQVATREHLHRAATAAKELLVGFALNLDQVRHFADFVDIAEDLADAARVVGPGHGGHVFLLGRHLIPCAPGARRGTRPNEVRRGSWKFLTIRADRCAGSVRVPVRTGKAPGARYRAAEPLFVG